MRGLLTAIKIVRATRKLEAHPKEPMKRAHLAYLEALVEQHLLRAQYGIADLSQHLASMLVDGTRVAVNRETGEVDG